MPARGVRATMRVSLALRCYHRYFNLVDRINKKIAALNMGMARCKKRYHRQLYIGWLLPAIANNVHVLFQCLYPEMALLRKHKRYFGLDRWLQYTSATVLFRHGKALDDAALPGSPTTRAAQGIHPAGMPKRRRFDPGPPPTPLPPRDAESHSLVNVRRNPHALPKSGKEHYKNGRPTAWWTSGGKCSACQKLAERDGYMVNAYEGERGRKPVGTRHMPDVLPPHWTHAPAGEPVPIVRTACKECSRRARKAVWLCEGCHKEHRCWDHEMATPAWHRVTVGGGA